MKKFLIVVILFASSGIQAQKKQFSFQSQNFVGLLEGDNGSSFQFQTVNGCKCGSWFVGAGTGIDWYLYRSVPLFVSVARDIPISQRNLFVSFDAGTNVPWYKRPVTRFSGLISSKFTASEFWGANIGYKAYTKSKKDALLISLGYSYKRLKERQESAIFCLVPPCPNLIENYDYKTRRFSLRLGWEF